jgi:hypothetical protein
MPYEISWHIEKHVVATRLYGEMTEEEFVNDTGVLEAFVKEGESPLILLFDLRDVTKFPSSFSVLLQSISTYRWHKQIAWTLVLSNNNLFNLFGVLASKATSVPMRSFTTMEAVDAFIAQTALEMASLLPLPEMA